MSSLAVDGRARRSVSHLRVLGSEHPTAPVAEEPLIERAVELDVLGAAVSRLAEREGGVVVLEAAAGLGKTALLQHATRLATAAGCLVRRAAPGPLERHFPFGAVRALLEAPLRDASEDGRTRIMAGPAATAGALLLGGTAPDGLGTTMVAHSLLWLCAAIADERPLALVIDDAQWCDRSSLEVLAYLARRIDDLPLLIVIGARAEDPDAASDLLSLIGGVRAATVLCPQPLTLSGAARLIRRFAPHTSLGVCRDCHGSVGGNPWLLGELGRQIAAHGPAAIDPCDPEAPPASAVARQVIRRRLAALGSRERAVVAALAVIGDGRAPHVVAKVAGVPVGELGPAGDVLVAAGLLGPDRERFAHCMIATVICEDLPRADRERLHHEAARALIEAGACADVVASQLLQSAPSADPEVSGFLVRAASEAAHRGTPDTAAAYLQRALSERAPGDDRGRLLARLATATFDAGLPGSRRLLREALHEARDRATRVGVLTGLAALNAVDGGDDGLFQLFDRELAPDADSATRMMVEAAALDALMMAPERHAERARRVAAVDLARTTDPMLQRVAIAHRAWLATELGTPQASTCATLALEALEGDVLLHQAWRRAAYHLCVRVLVMTDHAQEAREAIGAMRHDAIARGSLRLRAGAESHASELALRTGLVAEAEKHARLALKLVDHDLDVFTGGAIEVLVQAFAERGAFQEAHDLLSDRGLDGALGRTPWEIGVRHARAQLWLAEGDFERAYAEACRSGVRREEQWRPNPTWTAWRSTAALALAHLGRRDEAAALADTELALAEDFSAPVPIIRALHARAVAEVDATARVALCERALRIALAAPARLESVRVRLELGGALMQLGRRVAARESFRPALAAADAVGASLLADRARRELVASGLRPRRAALDGPAALTPRQRQICELAAAGKGNRAIAQQLFLSIKTVETHLASGYRKLGVNTRADLAIQLFG
jgi:DNA-binding CsgD family transcriptional regulator